MDPLPSLSLGAHEGPVVAISFRSSRSMCDTPPQDAHRGSEHVLRPNAERPEQLKTEAAVTCEWPVATISRRSGVSRRKTPLGSRAGSTSTASPKATRSISVTRSGCAAKKTGGRTARPGRQLTLAQYLRSWGRWRPPSTAKLPRSFRRTWRAALGGLAVGKAVGVVAASIEADVATGAGGSRVGQLVGRGYPTKLNSAGQTQPYNPVNGQYLSPSANPGLRLSPVAQVSSGFGQGYASAVTGGMVPDAVTNLQAWAQVLGHMVGSIAP